jgi:hypothetical protein
MFSLLEGRIRINILSKTSYSTPMKIKIFDLEKKAILNQTQLIYFLKNAAPKWGSNYGLD